MIWGCGELGWRGRLGVCDCHTVRKLPGVPGPYIRMPVFASCFCIWFHFVINVYPGRQAQRLGSLPLMCETWMELPGCGCSLVQAWYRTRFQNESVGGRSVSLCFSKRELILFEYKTLLNFRYNFPLYTHSWAFWRPLVCMGFIIFFAAQSFIYQFSRKPLEESSCGLVIAVCVFQGKSHLCRA